MTLCHVLTGMTGRSASQCWANAAAAGRILVLVLLRERPSRCIGRSGAPGPLHQQARVPSNVGGQHELICRV
jgi:hypothetical protein